ncbi:MAG: TrkA family potassium uptake protein [Cyclobacteriaceae bacterium]|jgi:trk system potassium uptake protein TrkA|nr:TrkA family potassium uptake protein [Cyclobacteriaceae bacterium]
MKYIVFGLGNYGAALSTKLVQRGHEVIGVDHQLDRVEKWKNQITHTVAMDATRREAIETLPLHEVDAVIVAIGENEGAIVMVAALLKSIGVPRIISRVTSPLQKTVLEAMNLSEFVYPEEEAAERFANQLNMPAALDSYRITDRYQVVEVSVPGRLVGSKVAQAELGDYKDLHLVAVTHAVESRNVLGLTGRKKEVACRPGPDLELKTGDTLVLVGPVSSIEAFVEG